MFTAFGINADMKTTHLVLVPHLTSAASDDPEAPPIRVDGYAGFMVARVQPSLPDDAPDELRQLLEGLAGLVYIVPSPDDSPDLITRDVAEAATAATLGDARIRDVAGFVRDALTDHEAELVFAYPKLDEKNDPPEAIRPHLPALREQLRIMREQAEADYGQEARVTILSGDAREVQKLFSPSSQSAH